MYIYIYTHINLLSVPFSITIVGSMGKKLKHGSAAIAQVACPKALQCGLMKGDRGSANRGCNRFAFGVFASYFGVLSLCLGSCFIFSGSWTYMLGSWIVAGDKHCIMFVSVFDLLYTCDSKRGAWLAKAAVLGPGRALVPYFAPGLWLGTQDEKQMQTQYNIILDRTARTGGRFGGPVRTVL